eukprot:TRINITY_DN148_c0_g1_i1.p1 TRINITY_DN148_c0_g1~~TRINITY_DN148_c0_g1_i1.p1  ORF type:complete len:522 (-),score=81.39 TRINITY_DN148_c0_g1_i1:279-1844(-)
MSTTNMEESTRRRIVDYGDNSNPDVVVLPIIKRSELHIQTPPFASGAFGKVYKGKCRGMDVAVKVLDGIEWDQTVLDEFIQEVGIMARLRNPNILLCMGACTEEEYGQNNYAIVMEYMPRGDLHTLIHKESVQLSLPKKMQFAVDICKGMAWLAAQNILHRDLKPANVLIDQNWTCKICDFGLSQITKTRKKIQDEAEAPGSVLWMAPEVLLGEHIDFKLDVYAFALVFWETLTRKELFDEYDDKEVFTEDIARKGKRPPLDDIHPVLQEILVKSWARNPDTRPSFEQLLPMLEKALIQIYLPTDLCPIAGTFWEKNFPARARVPLSEFLSKFCKTLNNKSTEADRKCLTALLKEEDGDEEVVTIERFSSLLKWFGKMRSEVTVIDKVVKVLSCPWFFGSISANVAEDKLKLSGVQGCFLVRLNMGGGMPIEKAPFSISRVSEEGNIVHTRVYPREKVGWMIQYGKGSKIRNKTSNLEDFIAHVKLIEPKLLTIPCPGWPYSDLFLTKPRPRSAYEEASDD